MIKKITRSFLSLFNLNVAYSLRGGFSIFGISFFYDRHFNPKISHNGKFALDYCISLNPKTAIDIGSGGGDHAKHLHKHGVAVTCIDFGTSIYSVNQQNFDSINLLNVDFNSFELDQHYDLVWASHVLEHQANVGYFIKKLLNCCSPSGYICITVPDPHRNLWGGHLTIWSPGLLAYNIVMCGVNLSDALFFRGNLEFSIFFRPVLFEVPRNLTFDSGDLILLNKYLPAQLTENSDPWKVFYQN